MDSASEAVIVYGEYVLNACITMYSNNNECDDHVASVEHDDEEEEQAKKESCLRQRLLLAPLHLYRHPRS